MLLLTGIILLISPFLLLSKFREKKLGFAYILVLIICIQFIIAIFTQTLGIFTYSNILILNSAITVVIILITFWKANFKIFLTEFFLTCKKLDLIAVLILVIAFISLSFVHYNYSGKIATALIPYQEAESLYYPYPYFADEWYAVAFIQQAIDSHFLPTINPLAPNTSKIINLELPFHSLLSEFTLFLGLNPLIHYSFLTAFFNSLIILLVYLLLVFNGVNRLSAGIVSLYTLYITNGASLPGIWYLLPLNFGVIFLLLGLIFISANRIKMAIFMIFGTLIFYPPLFVFYIPAILTYLFTLKGLHFRKKLTAFFSSFFFMIIAGIAVSSVYLLARGEQANFFQYIFLSKIYYPVFVHGFMPNYMIYDIIPVPILLLAVFGLLFLFWKKLWFVSMLVVGMTYWLVYSFATFRFIIEFERVIFVTSILLIITAGFGLNLLVEALQTTDLFRKNNLLNYGQLFLLILFVVFIPNYTKRENWQKLTTYNYQIDQTLLPAAPANKYLQPDDLELFKNIKYTRFLSIPWKGTAIGTATKNYPVVSKPGTISNNWVSLQGFMEADCPAKYAISQTYLLEYIYLPEFDCPNFQPIGRSREDLILYKTKMKNVI